MIPRVIIKFGKKNDGKEASEKILRSFPLKKRKNNLPTKKERNDRLLMTQLRRWFLLLS